VPKEPNPAPREFNVGDRIRVNLHHGKIEDATIRAVVHAPEGIKYQYQVDFGYEQTALISDWQIVKDS